MENTSESARPPVPTFPWPPAPAPTEDYVQWPTYLHLAAQQCERAYPGSPGRFLSNYIHALGDQAVVLGADSPEAHESKAEEERLREAAWIAALEASAAASDDHWEATRDEPDPNDDVTGSLDGHPADEEAARRVWLGDPGLDDTYCN